MRDVSTAYVLRSIICGVSVLYQLLFNTYENKRFCYTLFMQFHYLEIHGIVYLRTDKPGFLRFLSFNKCSISALTAPIYQSIE